MIYELLEHESASSRLHTKKMLRKVSLVGEEGNGYTCLVHQHDSSDKFHSPQRIFSKCCISLPSPSLFLFVEHYGGHLGLLGLRGAPRGVA